MLLTGRCLGSELRVFGVWGFEALGFGALGFSFLGFRGLGFGVAGIRVVSRECRNAKGNGGL